MPKSVVFGGPVCIWQSSACPLNTITRLRTRITAPTIRATSPARALVSRDGRRSPKKGARQEELLQLLSVGYDGVRGQSPIEGQGSTPAGPRAGQRHVAVDRRHPRALLFLERESSHERPYSRLCVSFPTLWNRRLGNRLKAAQSHDDDRPAAACSKQSSRQETKEIDSPFVVESLEHTFTLGNHNRRDPRAGVGCAGSRA
ncbi:hypothetical protein B0T11DRAFT_313456 [Plectosphaerella cucumerina]|uniref:Uncharacterized protein n=1 Tax=Plectosphaerella cucumerina TaxID=40658 RepID=A0A8K0TM17_9PEZI|nr:hypothetical protein B0T11DRAFT_313456 [Plectosphaerella cucumerina]